MHEKQFEMTLGLQMQAPVDRVYPVLHVLQVRDYEQATQCVIELHDEQNPYV